MKILLISQIIPYLPCHDGFRLIPASFIKCLSGRHEIHLISFKSNDDDANSINWANQYCASNIVLDYAEYDGNTCGLLISSAKRLRPDIVHLEGPRTAPFAKLFTGIPVLLSAHDSLSLRFKEFANNAKSLRVKMLFKYRQLRALYFESKHYAYADSIIITSASDKGQLSQYLPAEKIRVLTNGIDLDYWKYQPDPVRNRLVFTGNMSWLPNEDAVEYFVHYCLTDIQKVFTDIQFWIVGAAPSERVNALKAIAGVHITGTVEDIRQYIYSAAIYVSPLRCGAGVKNKVLEAMALGSPIVATPNSLTGTPVIDGEHLLVADNASKISGSVIRLLHDDGLRLKLSTSARRLVETEYSWRIICDVLETIYYDLKSRSQK